MYEVYQYKLLLQFAHTFDTTDACMDTFCKLLLIWLLQSM